MRLLALLLGAGSVLAVADGPITSRDMQREAAGLAKIAAQEPPLMALDTLLQTAVLLQPYVPEEAERLRRQAARHVERYPEIPVNRPVVRHWMNLDPEGGESSLRRLKQRRRVLEALMSHYESKGDHERAAALAVEAIRTAREGSFNESTPLRVLTPVKPLEAVDLFLLVRQDPGAQTGLADSAMALFDGLIRAAETQPGTVKEAVLRLKPILADGEFGKNTGTLITTRFDLDGRKVETKDNGSTALETLGLVERLVDPATRESARQALRTRSVRYESPRGAPAPVAADLPLERAIEEVLKIQPERTQLGELWRYLIGKPRTEAEAEPIVATLIQWAEKAPTESDPFWFLQSLLNLDGRLGPPGKQWELPAGLRPRVFQAAARAGQRADRDPDGLANLVEAMRREKVAVPGDVTSAQARAQLADLRMKLEQRYDFALPTLEGARRSLRGERGKIVVLNFWATWCKPCREELPFFERVYKDFGKQGLEIFAISDESAEKVRSFLSKNPLAIRVLLDEKRDVFDHYRVVGIPQTVVIDPKGRVVEHFKAELTEEQLRAAIAAAKK